jgi:uncharacterized protein
VSDFTVSVAEILGKPGEYRDVAFRAPLDGVATALARLTDDAIDLDLRLESVVEGVLVTGRVSGETKFTCARCLKPMDSEVDVEVLEIFFAPGGALEEDAYEIRGTEIDLEPMVRDALTLSFPLAPLCREECKGLCALCGRDLNTGPCDCKQEEIDPRWAPLEALKARLEP